MSNVTSNENSEFTAIIGGSGFYQLNCLKNAESVTIETPYGITSLVKGVVGSQPVIFMLRHGNGHKLPPHKVNYRANIWALNSIGVKQIIAINAVGGIGENEGPGQIVIPDQIIDYTYGREHTYADVLTDDINHVEFAEPYSSSVRAELLAAAGRMELPVIAVGCYACTQGPRLESRAEIARFKHDGNTLVGMTAMPEAALARELGLDYGSICIVANWAAGLSDEPITLEDIHCVLSASADKVQSLIEIFLG